MPKIRVRDEKGVIHVFPEGSTPEMISEAMGVKTPMQTAQKNNAQPLAPTNDLQRAMIKGGAAPTMYGLKAVGEGAKNAVLGVGQMLDPRAHTPSEEAAAAHGGGLSVIGTRFGHGIADLGKQALQVPGAIKDIAASEDPAFYGGMAATHMAGEGAGQAGLALATEGLIKGARGLNEATRPAPANASITEGLHVPTRSPKMAAAVKDVEGAKPFLKGVKSQADLQAKLPTAKAEIWEPYNKAVEFLKDKSVKGPDGPTTVGELEKQRLEISAQQQAAKKVRPTDQQTAMQAQKTQADLSGRYKQITNVLDDELRTTGIDPETIRKVHGNLKGVERNVSGKSTVTEPEQAYGVRKLIPYKAPSSFGLPEWQWKPVEGIQDIRAGKPLWSGKPTDVGIQRIFSEGGAKPDMGEFVKPVSGGSGAAADARSQYIRPIMTGEPGEPVRPAPAGEPGPEMRRTPTQTNTDIQRGVSRDPQLADLEAQQRGRINEIGQRYPVSNYPQTLQPYGEGLTAPPDETTPTSFYDRYGRIKR